MRWIPSETPYPSRIRDEARCCAFAQHRASSQKGVRGRGPRPPEASSGFFFRYGPDNRLLQAGDARYEHDSKGFRSRKVTPQGETRYHYAPDYRLLAVELPDGRVVEYGHDDQGLRNAKYVDGRLVERFRWHDRAHLAAWSHVDVAGGQWWAVAYGQDGRPVGLVAQSQGQGQRQGAKILLHTDQIGSVRMVEFPTDGMVKEILYDAFGNVVRDGNPYLRSPLGFAGGLHDWDTELVRFGWRDYDPDTGRFTAQDPIGAAGGDPDWYGYCLDDPVNGRDPEGLETKNRGYNPVEGVERILDFPDIITPWFQAVDTKRRVHRRLDEHKEQCEGVYGDNTQCHEYDKAKEDYGYWHALGDTVIKKDPKERADDTAAKLDQNRVRR
ncbi:MAG: RHS repeat-associated core domain-containing protein [Desulfovibrio sp.]